MTDSPNTFRWRLARRSFGLIVLVGAVLAGLHIVKLDLAATELSVHYRLGDDHQVQRLETSLRAQKDLKVVAQFAAEQPGSETVQKTRVADGQYDLRIDLVLGPDGKTITLHRELSVSADSAVTVDLRRL